MTNNNQNKDGVHIPIMLSAVIEGLDIKKGERVADLTINRAGHSIEFAKIIGREGLLIGNDLDNVALREANINLRENISEDNLPEIILINDNFKNIYNNLSQSNPEVLPIDKILLDLGLSSQELDISNRGFSFLRDEPLQMTFKSDPTSDDITAKDVVNDWSEELLSDIMYNFADEKYAKRIAREIVRERAIIHKRDESIDTTFQLLSIIKSALPERELYKKSHWATKTFQAIRMAVNNEIGNIIDIIQDMDKLLNIGGRVAIITFHSIEDRIVKNKMREMINFSPINKKVIIETEDNLLINRRARSAKLRIYEKIK